MTRGSLLELLAQVERGEVAPEAAAARLASMPYEDLGHARVDHHRSLRSGLPEVIYAAGKTPEQVVEIFASLAGDGVDVLTTRADAATAEAVLGRFPKASYNATARTIALRQTSTEPRGRVAVVCAGTSDLPVAEEAAVTAETFGAVVTRLFDVGVAGVHRLLAVREELMAADVVIVCAGMEGALPSVVGGLVGVPVVAVPTSVGYGASFGGVTALLGMLNSCSPNVTVVNIDNGFGAAYTAVLIARGAAGAA
ncbi:nickel pincer cofactor biosynthesis protein LarB [Granulicella sp. 5B5]|uniref:nickel pincer cofactor biosynthesis protein LarB n=1 Tax=Granulicella sp. 5B5 TaxID=1617967 RepID=UPI0015F68EF0|nr:nickel pincer cofactor biosynthesis protein LarB [Granulicella sp. 5B5]QMV19268.1 nickel pincer cofactor biosynthesis protein LarB [Granulicella sp. 5B5]